MPAFYDNLNFNTKLIHAVRYPKFWKDEASFLCFKEWFVNYKIWIKTYKGNEKFSYPTSPISHIKDDRDLFVFLSLYKKNEQLIINLYEFSKKHCINLQCLQESYNIKIILPELECVCLLSYELNNVKESYQIQTYKYFIDEYELNKLGFIIKSPNIYEKKVFINIPFDSMSHFSRVEDVKFIIKKIAQKHKQNISDKFKDLESKYNSYLSKETTLKLLNLEQDLINKKLNTKKTIQRIKYKRRCIYA